MTFYSPVFLFAFLPVLLLIYAFVPRRGGKNAVLIAASLLFYAFGDLRFLPLLFASALLHYAAGVLLLRRAGRGNAVVAAVTVLDLAVLLGCKLAGRLPLGISFYTFQAISYIVDTRRDPKNGSRRFSEVLQYITFFPQLVSGPLARFYDMRAMITGRSASAQKTADGLRRFICGLAKKLFIGGAAAKLADAVFALSPGALDIRGAWLGALCYMLQIYFDFSGYSDMAIGLGSVFGYELPENFRYPYTASSVTDFWRRWHISLSAWFRDYLYIPLGGNRRGTRWTALNKLAVFIATGLWHGVSPTFLLWGLWHGIFSMLETGTGLRRRVEHRWYGHVYTLIIVLLGFVLFRADSPAQAWTIVRALFAGFTLHAESGALFTHVLTRRDLFSLLTGVLLCMPAAPAVRAMLERRRVFQPLSLVFSIVLLLLCLMTMASGSFQPFIYARF